MLRIAYAFASAVLIFTLPSSARAQDVPADITVVSVLTMAKDEAEKARTEYGRTILRYRVAQFIESTGQQSAFGNYVADATSAWEAMMQPTWAGQDVVRALVRNRENEAEAKRVFLAGNEERAIQLLRQCEFVPHHDFCMMGRDFLHARFLLWELRAGRLTDASRRLHATDWYGDFRHYMALHVARGYAGAGRRAEGLDILRQIGGFGPNIDACVVKSGILSRAASFRMLACMDLATIALDDVLALAEIGHRTIAFGVVAEGLAGLPGLPDEKLDPTG